MMRTILILRASVVFILLCAAWPVLALAAAPNVVSLAPKDIWPRRFILDSPGMWRYHAGDDPSFADPNLDETQWKSIDKTSLSAFAPDDWQGIGWFRLRFTLDSDLLDFPFYLQLRHEGASEAFLDGQLVRSYGTIGTGPSSDVPFDPATVPPEVRFKSSGEHVLAIRYAYRPEGAGKAPFSGGNALGILCWLQLVEPSIPAAGGFADGVGSGSAATRYAAAFAGLMLALGLTHGVIFWSDPRRRQYELFLGVFSGAVALFVWLVVSTTPLGTVATAPYALAASATLGLAATGFAAFLLARLAKRAPIGIWFAPLVWLASAAAVRGRGGDERLLAVAITFVACVIVYIVMQRTWRAAGDKEEARYTRNAARIVVAAAGCLVVGGFVPQVRMAFAALAGCLALALMAIFTAWFATRTATARRALEQKIKEYSRLPPEAILELRPAPFQRRVGPAFEAGEHSDEAGADGEYSLEDVPEAPTDMAGETTPGGESESAEAPPPEVTAGPDTLGSPSEAPFAPQEPPPDEESVERQPEGTESARDEGTANSWLAERARPPDGDQRRRLRPSVRRPDAPKPR
jgi:hypothetical protein